MPERLLDDRAMDRPQAQAGMVEIHEKERSGFCMSGGKGALGIRLEACGMKQEAMGKRHAA
jgi:hypothetical protein